MRTLGSLEPSNEKALGSEEFTPFLFATLDS
jgi:hypothetical protein